MLYTLIFVDNTIFDGGDLKTTKWMEVPDKLIRSMFYFLPSGDMLGISNFKRIYHYVEVAYDLMGDKKGILQVEYTHLFIEKKDKILHYKIGQRKTNISLEILDKEDKIIKELNPIGWKNGQEI